MFFLVKSAKQFFMSCLVSLWLAKLKSTLLACVKFGDEELLLDSKIFC